MRRVVLYGLSCLLAVAGCESVTGSNGAERARLAQARSRWRAAAISDYRYELQRLCFCPPNFAGPYAITVRGGAVVSVVRPDTGTTVVPSPELHPTVEGLFDRIDAALDRDPDQIEVDYDPALGYPTRIAIDYVAMAADDEVTYSATGLSRLN